MTEQSTGQDLQQGKRVIDDVLTYMNIFHGKVDEHFGGIALNTGTIEEFRGYFQESKPRINLVNRLLDNLVKKFFTSSDNRKKTIAIDIKTIQRRWSSNIKIINDLSLLDSKHALSEYKRYDAELDENKRIILQEGVNLQKEIIALLKK